MFNQVTAFLTQKKKDGGLRPCIDYQGLNKITVRNRHPLPLMATAFELLLGASIFTKLDLRNAYHLVRIRQGDEWKTAFNTPAGHYEYMVMPFGLAVFQALINNVLRDMLNQFIFVYLDDILIFSGSSEEHEGHIRRVLKRHLDNHLYVKLEKCEFHVTQAQFLGFIIHPTWRWIIRRLKLSSTGLFLPQLRRFNISLASQTCIGGLLRTSALWWPP